MPPPNPLPPGVDQTMASNLFQHAMVELEDAWKNGDGMSLEQYCERHREIGPIENVPAARVYHEYCLRQLYGDAPPLASYKKRFPKIYSIIAKMAEQKLPETGRSEPSGVPSVLSVDSKGAAASAAVPQMDTIASQPNRGYKMLDILGSGSFADVWRGEAPGGIAVAIKILRKSLDADEAQRELQALELTKNLKHHFLLQTHSFWVQDNRLHIVMDLAEGSLRNRLKFCKDQYGSGIPLKELLVYMRESAEALDFLRKHKVYHRDIKPDNILLLEGHAKVADFGLARIGSDQSQRLVEASYAGTPLYMAPEVFKSRVSPNTDQYSLAATYYELRVGAQLFHSSNLHELILKHMEEKPDLSKLAEAEATVLHKALAKDPTQRYKNCSAFVQALEAAVAPVQARISAGDRTTAKQLRSLSSGLISSIDATDPETPSLQHRLYLQDQQARRRRVLIAGCLLGLATLFGAGAWWHLHDSNGVAEQTAPGSLAATKPSVPEPVTAYLPKNWLKGDDAKEALVSFDRKMVHDHVIVCKGDLRISFRYIPSAAVQRGGPFFIMENKVSNELFAKFASAPENQDALKDCKWHLGWDEMKKGYAAGLPPANLPVVNVTFREAQLFAKWLGGHLPSADEWDRAAGCYKNGKGPINGADPAKATNADVTFDRPTQGPRPVGESKRDRSEWGCRDMAGNGREWTRSARSSARTEFLDEVPMKGDRLMIRGRSFADDNPLVFRDYDAYIKEESQQGATQDCNDRAYDLGFRVVIEALP